MKNSTQFAKDIENWKKTNVLELANHFHELCPETLQHKRVNHFAMQKEYVDEFCKLKKINSIDIRLALDSEQVKDKFSFYPILEITHDASKKSLFLPFKAIDSTKPTPKGQKTQSALVPEIFKDMIAENWHNLEIGFIDDLFIAQGQNEMKNSTNQMVRVNTFEIGVTMMPLINELNSQIEEEDNISEITLYPGVDMNKFGNKKYISFTPVLGFSHSGKLPEQLNHQGIIETLEKEMFIEYSRPCPPTCKPKEIPPIM